MLVKKELKVYFLGTGTSQGIPVIGSQHSVCLSSDTRDKRLRVSIWIQIEDTSIVVDCGPDFRQQMLTSKPNATQTQVDLSSLTAGTYMVKVTSDEVSKTIKVVKN